MTTTVKEAIGKAKEENKKLVSMYLYKYVDFKNSSALKELMSVDYIKRNFKEGTLNYYLKCLRNYLKCGDRNKMVPTYVYDNADMLKAKCYPKLTPCEADRYKFRSYNKKDTSNTIKEAVKVETCPLHKTSKQSFKELSNIKTNLMKEEQAFLDNIERLKAKITEIEGKKSLLSTKVEALNVVLGLIK